MRIEWYSGVPVPARGIHRPSFVEYGCAVVRILALRVAVIAAAACGSRGGDERPVAAEASAPAPAAELDGKVVMHRAQAGTPDVSGWYPATSTTGGFSVSMPAPFNDFDVAEAQRRSEGLAQAAALGAVTDAGVKFAAVCFVYEAAVPSAADARAATRAMLAPAPELDVDVQHRGYAGFELRGRSGETYVAQRLLERGTTRCLLAVEGPAAAVAPANVDQFFASFVPREAGFTGNE